MDDSNILVFQLGKLLSFRIQSNLSILNTYVSAMFLSTLEIKTPTFDVTYFKLTGKFEIEMVFVYVAC